MSTADLGMWLGGIFGFGGAVGMIMGGFGASFLFPANERAQMRACAVALAFLVPIGAAFLFAADGRTALLWLIPFIAISSSFFGPGFALLQMLVPANMRATTLALVLLLSNFIGMGVGPESVGIISDVLKPHLGDDSLRWAMLILTSTSLLAAYSFWKVGDCLAEAKLSGVRGQAS
jgi:hypothetical protein